MLDAWGSDEEPPKKPIGQIFVERGFITSDQLEDALEEQKWSGRKLGEILMARGDVSRLRLWDALEEQAASFDTGPPTGSTPQARAPTAFVAPQRDRDSGAPRRPRHAGRAGGRARDAGRVLEDPSCRR